MSKLRADLLLVQSGLMPTRAKARDAIAAGLVHADGKPVRKPSELLDPSSTVTASLPHPWVSRAGIKLEAALKAFDIEVTGRTCLDVGASTGGFTQVLLTRGAAQVYAVDVGHDQLDPSLRADPRVINLEGLDARALRRDDLGANLPDLLVADVSFIGLEKVLPPVLGVLEQPLDVVVLVKPQFQAGPARVGKRGLVDPDTARIIAEEVRNLLDGLSGLRVQSMIDSPVTGGDGNHEFLLWAIRP